MKAWCFWVAVTGCCLLLLPLFAVRAALTLHPAPHPAPHPARDTGRGIAD